MLVVAVLRAQSLRSYTAVGNQMLSEGVYCACSELLIPCRSRARASHQRRRVFLSGAFPATCRARTGPEDAKSLLLQAPLSRAWGGVYHGLNKFYSPWKALTPTPASKH